MTIPMETPPVVAVRSANYIDPIRYIPMDDQVAAVAADSVDKINAGAALVHALYHCNLEAINALPMSVLRAYAIACTAYGVGGRQA